MSDRKEGQLKPIVKKRLSQLGVLGFGFLQDGDVGVGVFPESEEVFIDGQKGQSHHFCESERLLERGVVQIASLVRFTLVKIAIAICSDNLRCVEAHGIAGRSAGCRSQATLPNKLGSEYAHRGPYSTTEIRGPCRQAPCRLPQSDNGLRIVA
jgi:hypothetical protein